MSLIISPRQDRCGRAEKKTGIGLPDIVDLILDIGLPGNMRPWQITVMLPDACTPMRMCM